MSYAAQRIHDYQDLSGTSHSNGHEPFFAFRAGIRLVYGQRVEEHAFRIGKRNPVLLEIGGTLPWVELKAHV
jgi:hypothetical protein